MPVILEFRVEGMTLPLQLQEHAASAMAFGVSGSGF